MEEFVTKQFPRFVLTKEEKNEFMTWAVDMYLRMDVATGNEKFDEFYEYVTELVNNYSE